MNAEESANGDLSTQKRIALRAYELYLQRGGMNGHEVEDWLQAEREIIQEERHWMATAAAHLSPDQVGRRGLNFMEDRRNASREEHEGFSCFMPYDIRRGMIMNRVIIILSLVVITGYVIPDLSRAHRHVLALPEDERQSLRPTEPAESIGPVLKDAGSSQRSEQRSWDCLSLTHTDPPHLFGRDTHHSGAYRNSQPADGTALMFSWPFESLPTFQMNTDATPRETNLNQENGVADPYLRWWVVVSLRGGGAYCGNNHWSQRELLRSTEEKVGHCDRRTPEEDSSIREYLSVGV
jgi:hypothetical protein